jgi:exodeoxyribonuclease VII small subunit
MSAQKRDNLTKSLKEIEKIVDWFEEQDEVDVEEGIKKVKTGAKLIKESKKRLKEIENEFEDVKKELES